MIQHGLHKERWVLDLLSSLEAAISISHVTMIRTMKNLMFEAIGQL